MSWKVRQHIDYVGVDISQESIRMAQECNECNEGNPAHSDHSQNSDQINEGGIATQFLCSDIVECDFGENEFDIVIANDVINFLPPSETLLVLLKLSKWLCHEGEMFITAPLISVQEEATDFAMSVEEKTSTNESGRSGSSRTASPNFMCGIERSHPFIPGLFFRMFRAEELQDMGGAVGLQVRRVEIIEPLEEENGTAVPVPGPPVLMSGSPTAWGSGGGSSKNSERGEESAGVPSLPSLGHDGAPPYRAIVLIMETK